MKKMNEGKYKGHSLRSRQLLAFQTKDFTHGRYSVFSLKIIFERRNIDRHFLLKIKQSNYEVDWNQYPEQN